MVYAPRLEPFGLAPLEAGACALPVVAVAEGGVRETVIDGETGLVSHAKPDLFAECIDAITGDSQLATRLGENGRRRVETSFSLSGCHHTPSRREFRQPTWSEAESIGWLRYRSRTLNSETSSGT